MKVMDYDKIALSGQVYGLADTTDNPIKTGDMLTSSPSPGHPMKAGHSQTLSIKEGLKHQPQKAGEVTQLISLGTGTLKRRILSSNIEVVK